jgi:hypothetical protein
MESYVSRNGVNPQGSFGLHPRAAGMSGWMCIGGSSKITRTAEDVACPNLPVWFRLGRLRLAAAPARCRPWGWRPGTPRRLRSSGGGSIGGGGGRKLHCIILSDGLEQQTHGKTVSLPIC